MTAVTLGPRCVHAGGPVAGRSVLVQGGAGAVGVCAVQLARRGGARVIATVRSEVDEAIATSAGAHHVVRTGPELSRHVRALAPEGIHHIVEVAFGANISRDMEMLAVRGSVATRNGCRHAGHSVLAAALQECPDRLRGE